MAVQYGFYIDTTRCIGCHACAIACKHYHDIDAGTIEFRRVVETWGGTFPDVKWKAYSVSCMHCGIPACEAVCPQGAISKRSEDGIVVVDSEKCIGCHYCFEACPFGNPQFGEDGLMQKCDFCLDRLKEGNLPVCVAACPVKALHYGTLDELSELAGEKTVESIANATDPSVIFSVY